MGTGRVRARNRYQIHLDTSISRKELSRVYYGEIISGGFVQKFAAQRNFFFFS